MQENYIPVPLAQGTQDRVVDELSDKPGVVENVSFAAYAPAAAQAKVPSALVATEACPSPMAVLPTAQDCTLLARRLSESAAVISDGQVTETPFSRYPNLLSQVTGARHIAAQNHPVFRVATTPEGFAVVYRDNQLQAITGTYQNAYYWFVETYDRDGVFLGRCRTELVSNQPVLHWEPVNGRLLLIQSELIDFTTLGTQLTTYQVTRSGIGLTLTALNSIVPPAPKIALTLRVTNVVQWETSGTQHLYVGYTVAFGGIVNRVTEKLSLTGASVGRHVDAFATSGYVMAYDHLAAYTDGTNNRIVRVSRNGNTDAGGVNYTQINTNTMTDLGGATLLSAAGSAFNGLHCCAVVTDSVVGADKWLIVASQQIQPDDTATPNQNCRVVIDRVKLYPPDPTEILVTLDSKLLIGQATTAQEHMFIGLLHCRNPQYMSISDSAATDPLYQRTTLDPYYQLTALGVANGDLELAAVARLGVDQATVRYRAADVDNPDIPAGYGTRWALLEATCNISTLGDRAHAVFPIGSRYGSRVVCLDIGDTGERHWPPRTSRLSGGQIVVAAGTPSYWDGLELREWCPVDRPSLLAGSADTRGTIISQWRDNCGDIHRGPPALPVAGSFFDGTPISALYLNNSSAGLGLYRDEDRIPYEDSGSGFISSRYDLDGSYADFPIAAAYTVEEGLSVLSAELPPAMWDLAAVNGRLLFIEAEDRTRLGYTKVKEAGIFWESNASLRFSLPPEAGRGIAIAELDGNAVIFCETGVYATSGDGLDATGGSTGGSQNFSQPRRVCDARATARNMVINTPIGVFFESTRGYALLRPGYSIALLDEMLPRNARSLSTDYALSELRLHVATTVEQGDAVPATGCDMVWNWQTNQWSTIGWSSAFEHNGVSWARERAAASATIEACTLELPEVEAFAISTATTRGAGRAGDISWDSATITGIVLNLGDITDGTLTVEQYHDYDTTPTTTDLISAQDVVDAMATGRNFAQIRVRLNQRGRAMRLVLRVAGKWQFRPIDVTFRAMSEGRTDATKAGGVV